MLTPFTKMYGENGMFFSDEPEPQEWDANFRNLYKNYFDDADLPIYPLNYFYDYEMKSFEALEHLDDAQYFVDNDPYLNDGIIGLDVTKSKIKKIHIKIKDPNNEKDTKSKKVKKSTNKKEKDKKRVIRITKKK